MVTVIGMSMAVHPTVTEVQQVCQDNKNDRKWQKPKLVLMPALFGKKKHHASNKNKKGKKTVMMSLKPMDQRVAADAKCNKYHYIFERHIVYNLNPQNRKTSKK